MKITVNNQPSKKLVAVLGSHINTTERGIFLKTERGDTVYMNREGVVVPHNEKLEQAATHQGRVSIYKGDSITIEF